MFVGNKTTLRRYFGQLQWGVSGRRELGWGSNVFCMHTSGGCAFQQGSLPPASPPGIPGLGAASGLPYLGAGEPGQPHTLHLPRCAALELPAAAATHLDQRRPCAGHWHTLTRFLTFPADGGRSEWIFVKVTLLMRVRQETEAQKPQGLTVCTGMAQEKGKALPNWLQ